MATKNFQVFCCMFPECGREYQTKQNLKRHVIVFHLRTRQAQCEICEKMFINEINLKEHYLIHSDTKPYKCQICNMRFRHKSKFGSHKREHLSDEP